MQREKWQYIKSLINDLLRTTRSFKKINYKLDNIFIQGFGFVWGINVQHNIGVFFGSSLIKRMLNFVNIIGEL